MDTLENQPLIVGGCPLLEWYPNSPILDLEDQLEEMSVNEDNNINENTSTTHPPYIIANNVSSDDEENLENNVSNNDEENLDEGDENIPDYICNSKTTPPINTVG